jgi:hypothetical protein
MSYMFYSTPAVFRPYSSKMVNARPAPGILCAVRLFRCIREFLPMRYSRRFSSLVSD